MKVMLDTNVLISAFVFGGQAGRVLETLLANPFDYEVYVSEYVDKELRDKLQQKWPGKADKVYHAYRQMNFVFCGSTTDVLGTLRDKKDIPVLSDARYHKVDVLLTGDKDFLEADIDSPVILSPAMMLHYLPKRN